MTFVMSRLFALDAFQSRSFVLPQLHHRVLGSCRRTKQADADYLPCLSKAYHQERDKRPSPQPHPSATQVDDQEEDSFAIGRGLITIICFFFPESSQHRISGHHTGCRSFSRGVVKAFLIFAISALHIMLTNGMNYQPFFFPCLS